MKQGFPERFLVQLSNELAGELLWDPSNRLMHATDASAYRVVPLAVARPRNREDIRKLIRFVREHNLSLIPRTAGTSLAGQVVGPGIVVDVGRYMTGILELNTKEHWIRVEPGVILDELNRFVAPHGLFFGPETSTSSRCMMGGMVGNNSCGAHSILYGSTRDHLLSVRAILSDGTEAEFGEVTPAELQKKCLEKTLEGNIYAILTEILSDPVNRENIRREYPDPSIHRRNTGYAIDLLLETEPFARVEGRGSRVEDRKDPITSSPHHHITTSPRHHGTTAPLNLAKLLAGSEGTLALITEIKLNLVPLPPKEKALVCVHCHSVEEALRANLIALKFFPGSVELMDKTILDCTRENITQRKNRFFLQGDPAAILIVEFARESREEILGLAKQMEQEMRAAEYGYAFPVIFPPEMNRVWALRKAGLGVLSNYPGDKKPVAMTEDTAVNANVLPDYIGDFGQLMDRFGLSCVYGAHVGSGELHLRPVLNLKDPGDVELFYTVALETAKLVKKYRGSLSGEHGDGRLRGEFIPLMVGETNYRLLQQVKQSWDPANIFNPGKIVDTPRMNTSLRYQPGHVEREIDTVFNFSASQGILRAIEQCNGSGDCRNTHLTGVGMCPSYMALKEESATTRARANLLREFLTTSDKQNPFDHPEIYAVMDLCLACKACKSECPSNVDMTRLKAEFLQHWYDARGIPLRTRLIADITAIQRLGAILPIAYNFLQKNRVISGLIKGLLDFSPHRSLPLLYRTTLRCWLKKHLAGLNGSLKEPTGTLYLFVDEFTNYNDVEAGIRFVRLLHALGYKVLTVPHPESARTHFSKGLLRKARKLAEQHVSIFYPLVSSGRPLVGLEPSAILGFRDEYPDLVRNEFQSAARELSEHTLLYDEFLVQEIEAGRISSAQFTSRPATVKLHGHCHQKALGSVQPSIKMLSLPENYTVEEIPSGCCGMAGAFGYEKEHYEVSMKVGELVLFPEIRKTSEEVIIAAPGTSCRHQIMDGTGRKAYHPAEVLWEALDEGRKT
ncbi:MAG: FAD-binding oxidoreductase [Bacteroidetes bacterium]|nr:MAG: FAD-binding oxidoreductase [Bacteroidota bacterium]